MKAFWAHVVINLKLTARDRMVLFFNYAFPLGFFFFFGGVMHADRGGAAVVVVSMVITMGVLGNGFFGAGLRAAADREQNILRRFKVAPITPAPILFASLVTGLLNYLPAVAVILFLAHSMWGMPLPNVLDFFVFVAISLLAFRSLGLIVASSVNSMQESQVLVQLLYLPMLLLSIMPASELPTWAQVAAQYVPASYMQTGMQGILVRNEGLIQNDSAIGALLLTAAIGTFISMKLFRWDKDEKVRPAAKLWIVAVLMPFIVLGIYQTHTREALAKSKVMERNLMRSETLLIRDVRIVVGDGSVIEMGAVLIKSGKIAQVFEGAAPDAKSLHAETVEGAGKTILPGLIDVHVYLMSQADLSNSPPATNPQRELAAYLYSGVTTVGSVGDPMDAVLKLRATVNSGERLGAELYACGPMFTAPGGHGTQFAQGLPAPVRAQLVRTPVSPDDARQQMRELKSRGVDCIKAVLDTGVGMFFNRMDTKILAAIAAEARAQSLPLLVDTGDARDVADAVAAGATNIGRGSARDEIPDDVFTRMHAQNMVYDPTLTAVEAADDRSAGLLEPLERPLVQQVVPAKLLKATKDYLESPEDKKLRGSFDTSRAALPQARRNLLRAFQLGVTLAAGTDSGTPLVFHGPAVHRELQLWVDAGIPPEVALQAATHNAASLLGKKDNIGLIKAGYDANLIVVDGNPLKDIKQTEHISMIVLQGERIRRGALFEQE
jgi:imidazolonepropionase-like amidohydrolase/ABC-type multidrug transport system permease subunit